jgi:hypothetical protein
VVLEKNKYIYSFIWDQNLFFFFLDLPLPKNITSIQIAKSASLAFSGVAFSVYKKIKLLRDCKIMLLLIKIFIYDKICAS